MNLFTTTDFLDVACHGCRQTATRVANQKAEKALRQIQKLNSELSTSLAENESWAKSAERHIKENAKLRAQLGAVEPKPEPFAQAPEEA